MLENQLVGRERELAALTECLDAAAAGRPRLALCRGEPGIGKTRLAEEVLHLARGRGALAVWSRGLESSGAPPYWPWREALRALAEAVDLPAMAARHRLTGDLARMAPDVFGGEAEHPGARGEAEGTAEDRFRQFDAVGRLLRQLSRRELLVLVIDDAHWADQGSLRLLQQLVRTLRDERLLLVVTYRDTELTGGGLLAALAGEPAARDLRLTGLDAPAVGRQLATVVGRDLPHDDVRRVHAATGGNPFFVRELGRALAERDPAAPPPVSTAAVRGAIAARLHRLSPDCVAVLRAGAVLGPEFEAAVAAAVLDLPTPACLRALDEAGAAGLVEAGARGGERRFIHSLVHDAVEAEVSGAERVRLHRRAAAAIEARYREDLRPHLSDLARHWAAAAAAGGAAEAVAWIERAGLEARRRLAFEEAARLFALALDVGRAELDEIARCRLLLAAAGASALAADVPAALERSRQAADLARIAGRPELLALAALTVEPVGQAGPDLAVRRLCEEAATALDSTPAPAALRARLTARLADACMYLEDVEAARPASDLALELAERSGDPQALTAALRARQMVFSAPDGLSEREHLAARLLELGRDAGDAQSLMWARLWQIDAAFQRGDLAAVVRHLHELEWAVREVGGPLARFQLLRTQAVLAQVQARFDDALRFSSQAFTTVAPTGHPVAWPARAGLLAAVAHHVGDPEEAVRANTAMAVPGVTPNVAAAYVLLLAGRTDEAAARYRSLGRPENWRPTPHGILFADALGSAVAAGVGDREGMAVLRRRLLAHRGLVVANGAGQVACFGPVDLWLGRASASLGLLDEAVTQLDDALRACAASGAIGFHAEAQLELAAALSRRSRDGDLSRARTLAADSDRQAGVLGMAPIADRAQRLAAELDAAGPATLLSAREREVAGLVAAGLTNREIAERLHLSERTAQNHVQHILVKLGFSNRSQVAAWVASGRAGAPATVTPAR